MLLSGLEPSRAACAGADSHDDRIPTAHAGTTTLRRALVLDADPRTAIYFRDALERMGVHATVARSLTEVGPHVSAPPQLVVMSLPARDLRAHLDFATTLKSSRGTACIFVAERIDQETVAMLAEGAFAVLCKPVHREQLEATVTLALQQQDTDSRHGGITAASQERERYLEKTLRRIGELAATAGIGPSDETGHTYVLSSLRPREAEIVRLLLQHVRVPAIAQRLGIKQQTVRNHLKGAFKRTGVRSQQELLDRFASIARRESHDNQHDN